MASSQKQKSNLKELILKYKDKVNSEAREGGLDHKLSIDELDQLMALALHKNIEYIYKNPTKQLSRSTILTFKKLSAKRLANWSLAHLKGYKEFFGLKFLVNKHTLIPRPDSEILVEEAIKATKDNQDIIDIGTGSGALILSLAKNNKHIANYTATDISTKALKIAHTNARKLNLKHQVKFIKSDLLNNISGKFDIVLANLPYLTSEQMKETSINKEPITALVSGKDGLDHYKKLLKQLPKYLNTNYTILLEIDPNQVEGIKKEIEINLPKANISFIKDLSNNIRVVKITE